MPRSPAARTVRRSASTPRRCPSPRGNPRAAAHRPFPSMMMPTCRGTTMSPIPPVRNGSFLDIHRKPLNRQDFLFFRRQHSVDFRDRVISCFLYLLGRALALVLADLMLLLQLLEDIKPVAAHVTHCDPRGLRIFVGDFHKILAALFIELGNAQTQHLPLGRRS